MDGSPLFLVWYSDAGNALSHLMCGGPDAGTAPPIKFVLPILLNVLLFINKAINTITSATILPHILHCCYFQQQKPWTGPHNFTSTSSSRENQVNYYLSDWCDDDYLFIPHFNLIVQHRRPVQYQLQLQLLIDDSAQNSVGYSRFAASCCDRCQQ